MAENNNEITEAELDEKVLNALSINHTPFGDILHKIPPVERGEVRASLLRLQAAGRADLKYGAGWAKAPLKVVSDG
jgi:hypothetical protein